MMPFEPARAAGIAGYGLVVDHGNRGARQDVVELVEQDVPPNVLQFLVRVGEPGWPPGPLSTTARPPAKGSRTGGCPVLSRPGSSTCPGVSRGKARPTTPARPGTRPQRRRRTWTAASTTTLGDPSRSARRRARLHHLPGRPAAAVAVPEGDQGPGPEPDLGIIAWRPGPVPQGDISAL